MNLLSKLTIIILTYNRQLYALRNAKLWCETGATVHILDGSVAALTSGHLRGHASSVHYHHLPISVWERLANVEALVNTPYTILFADDDFFVPSAVEACIEELDKNEELVACFGRGLGKSLAADLIVPWRTIKESVASIQKDPSGETDHDDPLGRVLSHMNPYSPSTIYSVCRSQAWLASMRLLSGRQFSSGLVGEIQFELSISFRGKIKAIDQLMWLRSAENDSHTEGFDLPFDSWFSGPQYEQEVEDFLDVTAQHLASASPLDSDTIRHGVYTACKAYVDCCSEYHRNSRTRRVSKNAARFSSYGLLRSLKNALRKPLRKLPVELSARLPARLRCRPYLDLVKSIESAGVRVDWAYVNVILDTVRKFHGSKN